MRYIALFVFALALFAQTPEELQKAVNLNPRDVRARLQLGIAYMSQYIPGADTPQNQDLARRAEAEFQQVLQTEPKNIAALQALASLSYQQAQGRRSETDRLRHLENAERWYQQLAEAHPSNKVAYYSLGVIAWSKAYPEIMRARSQIGMRPEDPGPVRDNNLRLDLRNRYGASIAAGMKDLEKALELDPQYDDAMAYLNLLLRQQADLSDSAVEYKRDIEIADRWVQKALETKKLKGSVASSAGMPPPPPSGVPNQIRVGGNVQSSKLVHRPVPLYPQEAKDARIQGTVRYNVVINYDGTVKSLTLVSGHPLLVPSATEAVRQWRYQPTLLNGQAVEVVTQVDVNFTLAP